MEYVKPEDAKEMSGLRLALTAGVPAPFSMSAKVILDLRGVEYVPVEQIGGGSNKELLAWTKHRNAPVAVYNDEAPRIGWLEILNLAERLGSGPSLIPEEITDRQRMIGMTNELIGENGWVWNMRLVMLGLGGPERAKEAAEKNPMYADYGYSEKARDAALGRAKEVLDDFTTLVKDTKGEYLFGGKLSALDIYWVFFSNILKTFPEDICPMPSGLRKAYDFSGSALGDYDSVLIEHRDFIAERHIDLPMAF